MSAELHAICIAAAEAGAEVLRALFDQPREVHHKGRIDLVTDADRAAEARILAVLAERAPGVRVLAEESGAHGTSGEARFIVDPLDGTTNYAHGLPLYACTVAVEIAGTVVAGCTIDPSRGELFHARRGAGAFARRSGVGGRGGGGGWGGGGARKSVPENQPLRVSAARGEPQAPLGESQAALDESQAAPGEPQAAPGDRPLRVSSARELSQAVVCTGFPYDRREQLPWMLQAFARFTELSQGTRRLGSAALDLAFVAAGRLDGFWEQGLKPWDVAAGQVLVEEAGGLVTRYDGSRHDLDSGQILAAGGEIHAAMQRVLQAGRPD